MKPIMTPRFFKRNFFLAQKSFDEDYDDNGMPINAYEKPIAFLDSMGINYQVLTSESDIQRYGASSVDVVKAVIMNTDQAYKHFDEDTVGALAYLFDASPNKKPRWDRVSTSATETKNGYWANYKVDAVMPMLVHTNVFFIKNKRTGAG